MRPVRCTEVQPDAPDPSSEKRTAISAGTASTGLHSAQRWQDISSWLTSFVLHLISFLLVTSISVPWAISASRGGATGSLSLTMEFGTEEGAPDEVEVIATRPDTTESTDGPESIDKAQGDQVVDGEPAPQPTAPRPTAPRPSESQQARRSQPQPPQTSSQFAQWLDHRMEESPAKPESSSRYAAILNRVRTDARPVSASHSVATMAVTVNPVDDPQQMIYDRVVDGFIAYDVGQLRGQAGQRARREFMQLGPDAVPAIVRGLNKSAQIHASCPVAVLAGKLIQTLRQSHDPSLTEYAIDQVGRDVPEDAPHFRRLMALRQRWLGQASEMSDQVASLVTRQTLNHDGELLELVLALTDAPADTLLAALESGDTRLCNAALIALTRGSSASHTHQRRLTSVIQGLIDRPADSQQRSLAREALTAIQHRS